MTHENGTEALPLVVDAVTAQARESKKTASVPSVAFGFCPDCNRADQRGRKQTGLLRVGAHLVWRHHNVVTWGGGASAMSHRRRPRLPGADQGVTTGPMPVRDEAMT